MRKRVFHSAKRFLSQEKEFLTGVALYLLAWALFLAGTYQGGVLQDRHSSACMTFKGFRESCWRESLSWRTSDDHCPPRRRAWRAGGYATAVAEGVFILPLLLLGWERWYPGRGTWCSTAPRFLPAVVVAVPLAVTVVLYYYPFCDETDFTGVFYQYGLGFLLWAVSLAVLVGAAVWFTGGKAKEGATVKNEMDG